MIYPDDHARLPPPDDYLALLAARRGPGPFGGVNLVQLLAQLVPDQVDEPGHPELLPRVVQVEDQHPDARQHQHVRHENR